jgi:hypothetical protein
MADAWDEYIRRQQEMSTPPAPSNPFASIPLLGKLFGSLGGGTSGGGIQPNKAMCRTTRRLNLSLSLSLRRPADATGVCSAS